MDQENDTQQALRVHKDLPRKYDDCTKISVSRKPSRGTAGKRVAPKQYNYCGACMSRNTICIWHTSGATADGTVVDEVLECQDCGVFTHYWYSDRV